MLILILEDLPYTEQKVHVLYICLIQFTGVEAISGVSLVAFTILAWIKFVTAEKLHSEALRTDGMVRTKHHGVFYFSSDYSY